MLINDTDQTKTLNMISTGEKIHPGMINDGNDCYMIVVMQALFSIDAFRNYLLDNLKFPKKNDEVKNNSERLQVWEATKKLFTALGKSKDPVSISEFKRTLVSTSAFHDFDNSNQQDSHDFLTNLLFVLSSDFDSLETEEEDIIKQLFQSTIKCHLDCYSCKTKSINDGDKSNILDISICGNNLIECLNMFFGRELLKDYKCAHCNKIGKVWKKLEFTSRRILILSLKRYTAEGNKDSRFVNFPLKKLEIVVPCFNFGEKSPTFYYNLMGMINHHGSGGKKGHYTAILKQDDYWYKYDDQRVTIVEERTIVSNEAYILMYYLDKQS